MNNEIVLKIFDKLPDESRAIREEVFVVEQGFTEEFDTVDHRAIHILAYDNNGRAVGTCRLFNSDEPEVLILGRLAVCKECRSLGIGSMLLERARQYASDNGFTMIKLHSQIRAKEFYEKNDYVAYGEIEDDEGYPHIWMVKRVGKKTDE